MPVDLSRCSLPYILGGREMAAAAAAADVVVAVVDVSAVVLLLYVGAVVFVSKTYDVKKL